MLTTATRALLISGVLTCLAPLATAAASPPSDQAHVQSAPAGKMMDASARGARVKFSVDPQYAAVGQVIKVKGRVSGNAGARRKVKVTGAQTVKVRTKRTGKFAVSVNLPADRVIRACLGSRCASKQVADIPDSIAYAWTNSQGYSFSSLVTGMGIVNITTDTLNAPPGEANISLSFKGDAAVTNTTPGKNAPPMGGLWLTPVFPAASTLCQATSAEGSHFWSTTMMTKASSPTSISTPIPFCAFRNGYFASRGTDLATLSPGQTAHSNYALTPAGQTFQITIPVPQSLAPSIAADLANPSFWSLTRGLGTTVVPNQCLAWAALAATSRGGLTTCAQGVQ